MAILSCILPWLWKNPPATSSKPTSSPSLLKKSRNVHQNNIRNAAKCRIQKELKCINEEPLTHCSFGMVGDDIFRWQGTIMGPSDTPFEGNVFFVSIEIPDEYHFKPPKIRFITKI
ncbi:hypothetical protein CRYUN_Cryun21dG0100000 [Craigia yunnanensis]